jgi:putative mycofactocin binding protein MftB
VAGPADRRARRCTRSRSIRIGRTAAARAWRPEPFGALAYHFGTRRLSFLKTPQLVAVVSGLADHPDVGSALDAAGVDPAQRPAYLRALAGLAENGTIEPVLAEERR